MSELWSSGAPSKMIIMCMFRGLAFGVPLRSHLLKISRSQRACPLLKVSPRESLVDYLV